MCVYLANIPYVAVCLALEVGKLIMNVMVTF